jgi:hypothetical protein
VTAINASQGFALEDEWERAGEGLVQARTSIWSPLYQFGLPRAARDTELVPGHWKAARAGLMFLR